MASRDDRTSTTIAGVAFAAMAVFLGWAFSTPGTLGLYRWGYSAPFLALAALGTAPLAVSIAARSIRNKAPRAAAMAGGVGIALSVLALMATVGVSAYIMSNAYGTVATPARPALVDTARGLRLRAGADGSAILRVAMSSDPHWGRDESNAEARASILRLSQAEYEAGRLDAFFALGDTVEMGMLAGDWNDALDDIHREAPTLPFVALMGNHDAMIGGSARWKAAFAAGSGPAGSGPAGSGPAGSGPAGVPESGLSASSWRMDAGPVHFIALDLLWGPEGFGKRQKAWLESQLASIPAEDWIVVLSHAFFHSSGYVDEGTGKPWYDHADNLREIAPMLAGRADLVVSGHNHYMEWIEADGTAWAVVGAMGGKPDPLPTYVAPGSVWFSRGRFGRLVVELSPEGLACQFQDHEGNRLFSRTVARTD